MVYRNIKTGAEIFSNSVIIAPGFVLVEDKTVNTAPVEDCVKLPPPNKKEPPVSEEAPKTEQPKKKSGTKKKGTKK